ncbi:uncharacterized protein PGTG_16360 [Puccinia graminis f. sp. tritici CRL 75-36-700-3]|uniref:Tyr recombinase domain-containing protein n=1 Tax=Puccinia graminis f. sp. tritici (strain CRL 75-36-700-3 / race SCCL) TaxID=418459 RepID=E3L160_PUCGT|nr:uncharacterized protein PGTG_16360 [Puccinia graminis f. sp. tritici CRL 75-36-700-3]EFP90334.1 hypothetical protein PGTG_16360 [Puccinia graminis f. sp. tritici CRL 75-36-700-3]
MAPLELSKLKAFLADGSEPREPLPIDIHYLKGFKWNTIVSYNTAVKKYMRFKEATNGIPFRLPNIAETLQHKGALGGAVLDMALTAFWGMARLAEVTYATEEGPIKKALSLLTSDVQQLEAGSNSVLNLVLRSAKTCTPGTVKLLQQRNIGGQLCPVKAIQSRLEEAGGRETSLFGYFEDGVRHHVTRNTAVAILKEVWANGGFHSLSGHSFRVGGASLRMAMGVPIEEICQLGRWTSNCYKLYIREYSKKELAEAKIRKPIGDSNWLTILKNEK